MLDSMLVKSMLEKKISGVVDGSYAYGTPYIDDNGNLRIISNSEDISYSLDENGNLIVDVISN